MKLWEFLKNNSSTMTVSVRSYFEKEWGTVTNISVIEVGKVDSIWAFWIPRQSRGNVLLVRHHLIHIDFSNVGGFNILVTFVYVSDDK